jgi:holliday junction DNA helicase RuvB
MGKLGVDSLGLGKLDLAYLRAVSASPLGLEAIASRLNEQKVTVEAIEGHLVQAGLVERTRKGRVVTDAGRQHLTASV